MTNIDGTAQAKVCVVRSSQKDNIHAAFNKTSKSGFVTGRIKQNDRSFWLCARNYVTENLSNATRGARQRDARKRSAIHICVALAEAALGDMHTA